MMKLQIIDCQSPEYLMFLIKNITLLYLIPVDTMLHEDGVIFHFTRSKPVFLEGKLLPKVTKLAGFKFRSVLIPYVSK